VEMGQPGTLFSRPEPGRRLLRDRKAPGGVTIMDRVLRCRTPRLFERVLSHRFQEPIAGLPRPRLNTDQRHIYETRQEIQYWNSVLVVARADSFGCVQRPATDEYGQAMKRRLLSSGQQVVAPVQRGPQSTLPRHHRSGTAGQELELI